jgi:hypothetical protein
MSVLSVGLQHSAAGTKMASAQLCRGDNPLGVQCTACSPAGMVAAKGIVPQNRWVEDP